MGDVGGPYTVIPSLFVTPHVVGVLVSVTLTMLDCCHRLRFILISVYSLTFMTQLTLLSGELLASNNLPLVREYTGRIDFPAKSSHVINLVTF